MRRGGEFSFWRPGDLLVVAALAAAAVLLGGGGGGNARTATIVTASGGETVLRLDRDTIVTVDGHLGELELEVRDGRIRVMSSPCPGQQCVSLGWVGTAGDAIVCVPSGVYVRLDPEEGSGVDAVTY